MCITHLKPIIKWPGGKENELEIINQYAPSHYVNLYDPFVGGGSVSMYFDAQRIYVNDLSTELISIFKNVATNNRLFFQWLDNLSAFWRNTLDWCFTHQLLVVDYCSLQNGCSTMDDLLCSVDNVVKNNVDDILNLLPTAIIWNRGNFIEEVKIRLKDKIKRMRKIETQKGNLSLDDIYRNIETGLMNSVYMFLRNLYNDKKLSVDQPFFSSALFFFIRSFSYSGMFRYNKNGEFNVPYGGMGYNHRHIEDKIAYYRSQEVREHLAKFSIFSVDFLDFLRTNPPTQDDFIFIDPPYDSEFSTYAQNEFSHDDQKRLANYLCSECKGKWMVIIKNTDFIYALYNRPGVIIRQFDKRYQVSFMNRNNQSVTHLLITNY